MSNNKHINFQQSHLLKYDHRKGLYNSQCLTIVMGVEYNNYFIIHVCR